MLLQHFYADLNGETAQLLDSTSGGSFLHCPRNILRKILENTSNTSIYDDVPEEIVGKIPEEPLIVEPEPLATSLEASTILQVPEPPKEEEIFLWKICLNSRMSFSPILETP